MDHRPVPRFGPGVRAGRRVLIGPYSACRVIGDWKLQSKEVSQGTQEALGLAEGEVKDHADRKRSLDGQV